MYRSLLTYLAGFTLLACSSLLHAGQVDYSRYDIYYGDTDGDGIKDVYFRGKDYLVLLHGNIITPINIDIESLSLDASVPYKTCVTKQAPSPGVTYEDCTDNFDFEDDFRLLNDIEASDLSSRFELLENGFDYHIGDFNGDGLDDIIFNFAGITLDRYRYNLKNRVNPVMLIPGSTNAASLSWSGSEEITDFSLLSVLDIDRDGKDELTIPGGSSYADLTYNWQNDSLVREYNYDNGTIKDPTLHGASAGNFRIDENGAATYSIPLTLPIGTAGVTPELAFNYSSQAGNSDLGVGWSLSGLSTVSRCRQTLIQDGAAKPLTWNSNDRFCYNGQRLTKTGYNTYATEIADYTLFTRHGSADNPSHFTAVAKDGSLKTFGRTSDAKQLGTGNKTLTWHINESADNIGNKIKYLYEGGINTRIKRIEYAIASGQANAQVEFLYTGRPDPIVRFLAGTEYATTTRLNSVVVKNREANSATTGLQEIRRYNLEYQRLSDELWAKKSHMTAIQECVKNDCLPETKFDWALQGGLEFKSPTVTSDIVWDDGNLQQLVPFDVNGDGYLDLAWTETHIHEGELQLKLRYGIYQPSTMKFSRGQFLENRNVNCTGHENTEYKEGFCRGDGISITPLDYNGDGRQDLAVYSLHEKKFYFYISKANASGKWYLNGSPIELSVNEGNVTFFDVNSDGLMDIVSEKNIRYLTKNNNSSDISLPYSYSSPQAIAWSGLNRGFKSAPSGYGAEHDTRYERSFLQTGDFNGDGNADLVVVDRQVILNLNYYDSLNYRDPYEQQDHYYLAELRGSSIVAYKHLGSRQGNIKTQYHTFGRNDIAGKLQPFWSFWAQDINFDGYSDLLINVDNDNDDNDRFDFYLNNGQGFDDPHTVISNIDSDDYDIQLQDLNNDRYLDFQFRQKTSGIISYKPWDVINKKFDIEQSLLNVSVDYKSKNNRIMFYDATADGHIDLIYFKQKSIYLSANKKTGATGQISQFTNGLGAKTKIEYELLNNTDHYIGLKDTATNVYNVPRKKTCHNYTNSADEVCTWTGGFETTTFSANDFYDLVNNPFADMMSEYSLSDIYDYPVLEYTAPMYLAVSVEGSNPTAGINPNSVDQNATSKIEYFYEHARMQAAGRGFLGFKKLTTLDSQSGVSTTTTYRQDWPFNGLPLSTEQVTAQGQLLSRTENKNRIQNWLTVSNISKSVLKTNGTSHLPPLQVQLAETQQLTRAISTSAANPASVTDLDSDLQTTRVQNVYDAYGNLVKSTNTVSGDNLSLVKVVKNDYDGDNNFATQGLGSVMTLANGASRRHAQFGRLTKTEVATTRAGLTPTVHTSTFSYYASGTHSGLLKTEAVNVGSDAEVTTQYGYDAFGNKVSVITTAKNHRYNRAGSLVAEPSQTRSSSYIYDSTGRYVDETQTSVNEGVEKLTFTTEKIDARSIFGTPTQISNGLNELTANISYDALGREIGRSDSTGASTTTEYRECNAGSCPTGATYYVRKTASGGAVSLSYFDVLGRTVREASINFNGSFSCIEHEFDSSGRTLRSSQPFACSGATGNGSLWTSNTYDIFGRVVKTTSPHETGTAIQTYTYTGDKVTVTNPLGQKQTEVKNGLGELVSVTDAMGGRIVYEYDNAGNLEYMRSYKTDNDPDTAPSVITTHIQYDAQNRKIAMNDPDKGNWQYKYNAFDELVWQRDANGQVVINSYDNLGRMLRRTDYKANGSVEQHTRWYYDGIDDAGNLVDNSDMNVTAVVMSRSIADETCGSGSWVQCSHPQYDNLGRNASAFVSNRINNQRERYVSRTKYDDSTGRVVKQYDVLDGYSNLTSGTKNTYNAYGYLASVTDLQTNKKVYELKKTNVRNQATEVWRGNGVTSYTEYFAQSGQIKAQQASNSSLFKVQNITYNWDKVGNLLNRKNTSSKTNSTGTRSLQESFCYDGLNRLVKSLNATTSTAGCSSLSSSQQDMRYDSRGNILYKNGVGSYTYDNAKPHAVSAISGGESFHYDHNGNVTSNTFSGGKRSFVYTTFDKPTEIKKYNGSSVSHTTRFAYGIDRSRFLRTDIDKDGVTTTTQYLGNIEKIIKSNAPNRIEWKRYLGKTAIITLTTDASGKVLSGSSGRKERYVYNDHLGSLDVITDANGTVVQSMSFTPWGERRHPETWTKETIATMISSGVLADIKEETTRGFTGHEMVDEVGIIHMNGRIFDARISRFLQADPFIQAATNTQSLNRYSYTYNNPLNATDPSGYLSYKGKNILRKVIGVVVGVVAFYVCGAACSEGAYAWAVAAAVGAGVGAVAAALNGADASGVLRGALGGAVAGAAGGYVQGMDNLYLQAAVVGVAGGVASIIHGGKFGHGFTSGALSSVGAGELNFAKGPITKGLTAAVIGGTVSEATGGKFGNGAAYAAFSSAVSGGLQRVNSGSITDGNVKIASSDDACALKVVTCTYETVSTGEYESSTRVIADTSVLDALKAIDAASIFLGVGGVAKAFVSKAFAKRFVTKGPLARGRASEARVLDDLGLPKNNKKVSTAEGNSIPDALTSRQSIEIKDTICVSCTKQVRIQTGAAREAGRESVLVTGSKTRVSGPANRAFDRVIRRDDLGPQ